MKQWKIYYGDGTTFDSDDGLPVDAPATNIQLIAQYHPELGRHFIGGQLRSDFYLFVNDEWIDVDLIGLLDHLMAQGIVKSGRMLPTSEWKQIQRRALNDPDMPKKSAWDKRERHADDE